MRKRRRLVYRRRPRVEETIDDGQDSFLDVVSNLVGILIILVMIAGNRVHDAASEMKIAQAADETPEVALEDQAEQTRKAEYVAAVEALGKARMNLEKTRVEAEDYKEQQLLLERQADAAEQEYRALLAASAEIDAALKIEAKSRADSEQLAFDMKSEIFEKEKKLDDLQKEKEALQAARPKATVLENVPTPISKRVDGREGFFQLKNGRIAHVPLNEFQERLRLSFKNFRGDLTKKTIDERIGPVENFNFHYIVDLDSSRDADGVTYYMQLRYGECIPLNDEVGEPVDVALASKDSEFSQKLLKYNRGDTTITIFVYPDSFQYLRDVKKLLFSLKYQMAMRPLPNDAPIAVSPYGTSSATY